MLRAYWKNQKQQQLVPSAEGQLHNRSPKDTILESSGTTRIIPSATWDSFVETEEADFRTTNSSSTLIGSRNHNHNHNQVLRIMGNANSSASSTTVIAASGASCASGFESIKSGMLTTRPSQEELDKYVMAQEFLEQAKSPEEASQVSRLSHTDSMEQLLGDGEGEGDGNGNGSSPEVGTKTLQKRRSFRVFRQNRPKVLDKIAGAFQAVGKKFNDVEGVLFPHTPQVGSSSAALRSQPPPTMSVIPKVKGGVLLRGCMDDEEHRQVVRQSIAIMKELKGEEGLRAMGLEYRSVPVESGEDNIHTDRNSPRHSSAAVEGKPSPQQSDVPGLMDADEEDETMTEATEITDEQPPPRPRSESVESIEEDPALSTMQRLFHAESNTLITMKNRKEFVADGDMYDHVARLCQEYAQAVMIEEGDLEWVTVCEAGNNAEPIRALVSTALSKDDANLDKVPTLLIATGRGKVRAGIFSRQHLLMSGMECSTALPIVREANKRKMNVVMLDPNVHGDRMGMVTFEKSMAKLFQRWESDDEIVTSSSDQPPLANRDLFVLSHSQSGAQFARYLLEKSNHYVPHIRAVAFTDSTHNIQWARKNQDLHQLLQSDTCVYFKCAQETPKEILEPLKTTGEEVETDHFWEHRFGNIKTKCAGTAEHSLTNWFARTHIWDHFDQFLHGPQQPQAQEQPQDEELQSQ